MDYHRRIFGVLPWWKRRWFVFKHFFSFGQALIDRTAILAGQTRHFSFSSSGYLTFVIYGFAVATILTVGYVSDRIFRRGFLAGIGWILAAIFLMAAAFAPISIMELPFSRKR